MTKLTANQAAVMLHYNDRVGETFDVLCGYLTNAVASSFKPFGPPTTIATLRGLETKGFIRIVDSFWKGATVTVLKAFDAAPVEAPVAAEPKSKLGKTADAILADVIAKGGEASVHYGKRELNALRQLEAANLIRVVRFFPALKTARVEAKPAAFAPAKREAMMDRYRAAYRACHGRTVVVVWTGAKFRVHTPGENPAYDVQFDGEEMDEVSARMEAKVVALAADREAAANAPDPFEELGLPKSASAESAK